MTDTAGQTWSESDSDLYGRLAPVAVPARAEQMAALLTLLPFRPQESFRAVEIGCGQGLLSYALLDCFPRARLTALDGSAAMRSQAQVRLVPFGRRAVVRTFRLAEADWLPSTDGTGAVLSSLCLHHLTGPQKQALFSSLFARLAPGGALLIADLVQPQRPQARELFAATWDRLAHLQSIAETGSSELFEQFREAEWNYYSFDDPVDTPSPLAHQLQWLREAGFQEVDCFWLQAGHAIYGGYKKEAGPGGVSFADALQAAERALEPLKH
jgi:tRNA (cmo5U34)-methyltransferase